MSENDSESVSQAPFLYALYHSVCDGKRDEIGRFELLKHERKHAASKLQASCKQESKLGGRQVHRCDPDTALAPSSLHGV
jgi:hypothetical protein